MAASTTIFSVTPIAGANFAAKGSTEESFQFPALTEVTGSDGKQWMVGRAAEDIGSVETCNVDTTGLVTGDSGSAGWTANVPGGATAGQFFWLNRANVVVPPQDVTYVVNSDGDSLVDGADNYWIVEA